MAITTLDGLIAGFRPTRYFYKGTPTVSSNMVYSFWGTSGIPGPGSYDTTLNGVVLSSTSAALPGQLPFNDPGSGNSYLARWVAMCSQSCAIFLCDRLWHNGGYTITSTSAQNSTTPTWPARDNNGSTNGDGVILGVEVSATVGAATPSISVSYTNSAGTSGRAGTATILPPLTGQLVGSFTPISLQAGDIGVRSVQSLTLSASWISGTINLVAYRVISMLEVQAGTIGSVADPITGGLPQMFNGSVPYLMQFANHGGSAALMGSMTVAQG